MIEQNIYVFVKAIMAIVQAIIAIWFFDNMLEDNEKNNKFIKSILFVIIVIYLNFNSYKKSSEIYIYYIIFIIYVNLFKKQEGFFNIFRVVQFMTDNISINILVFIISAKVYECSILELIRSDGILKVISIFIIFVLQIIVLRGHLREKVIMESFTANRIATFSVALVIMQITMVLLNRDLIVNPVIATDRCILVGLLFIISMFFYSVLTFIAKDAEEKYTLRMKVKENEFEEKYINEVSRIYREIQKWKHDYRNNINVICNLATEKRIEEMKQYIMDSDSEVVIAEKMIYTGIFIIDSIITSKYIYANNKGINLNVDTRRIKNTNVSNYDFNIILSNLLDNAIEATEKVENGQINIVIREKYNKIIIHILNDMDGNIEMYNGKYISSKKESFHGIGLIRVKETVKKYKGHMLIDFNDNIFECKVILDNVKL